MKVFRINRKSVLLNLILSYILILFIALFVYFFAYNVSKNVLKKEVENNYLATLSQLKLGIDNRLNDIESIGTELNINKKIDNLTYRKGPFDIYDSYEMLNIIDKLHSWKAVNNFVEDINVYLPNFDVVLTDNSSYAYENWYKFYYKSIKGIGMDEFKEYLNKYHKQEYTPIVRVYGDNNQAKMILYTYSLYLQPNNIPKATLVINIKESFLKELLNNYDSTSGGGKAFILDKDNNIISGADQLKLPEEVAYEYLHKEPAVTNVKLDDKSYMIVHIKSDVNNWIYGFAVPYSVFFKRLNILSGISVISIGFCLFLATAAIYYFTRKNYTPIEALIQIFSKYDSSYLGNDDEHKYIENIARKMIAERDEMNNKINENKMELKNNFLIKLLRGKINDEQISINLCKEYEISFSNRIAVILIKPKQSDNNKFQDKSLTFDIFRFIVKDSFEKHIVLNEIGYVIEVDNKIVCIVNVNQDNLDEAEKELIKTASESQKIINAQCGVDIFIAISSMHSPYSGIAEAYQEACETMEYQVLIGDVEILDFKTINNYSDVFIVEDFENNKKIRSYIESGDFRKAKEMLKTIFQIDFFGKKKYVTLYEMKVKMYGLINIIVESMYDLTAKYDYDFFININPEKKILKCDSLRELYAEMVGILNYADNYVKSLEKAKNDNLLDKVIDFINLHYNDYNLSVTMISEEFGVTVPYLSKFFKKKMDKGLLDYIHSVRIEQAKRLLKEETLTIKEIAELTGYYNDVAFIRVFKKFEGMSPGKYRYHTL